MRALHFAVAAIVGFLLYQFAVVYVGGYLAAVTIPAGYFRFFGREYGGVGHALLGIVLHALPTLLLIAGGILAAELPWVKRSTPALLPYFVGMLCCLLVWEWLQQSACLPPSPAGGSCAQAPLFQNYLAIPWWALPVVASPWLGLGLAAWVLKRRTRVPQRSVA
jgi:hypothetical protein